LLSCIRDELVNSPSPGPLKDAMVSSNRPSDVKLATSSLIQDSRTFPSRKFIHEKAAWQHATS
jgi:hypothetical protein